MNIPANRGLVYVAIITQFGLIGNAWVIYQLNSRKTAEVALKTTEIARKTEEVKQTLKADTKDKSEKLEQIHVLVNSRLTLALDEIKNLKKALGIPVTETPPQNDLPQNE